MLSDHITQLLSAYVDGELNSRERKHITRILRKSSEARQLLHKLKQDSMILRHLPRKKTQIDLTESAMGTLSLRGIQLPKVETAPVPAPPPSKRPRSTQVVIAVVVAILLVVALASYLFFSNLFRSGVGTSTNADPGAASGDNGGHAGSSIHDLPEGPPVIAVVHEPETPAKGGNPQKDDRAGLTLIRPQRLVTAQPRLMSILALRDLDQDAPVQQVVQELKKDGMSRLDLFCKGGAVGALDQLEELFKAHNVTLRRDAYAQARITQRLPTNFAVYCEDLTAEEFGTVLQQLAREDRKTARFDRLTVNSLTAAEIAGVLGGEPSFYQIQDVAAQTGNQVARSLAGQGKGKPSENPSADRTVNHLAVAVPYLPQPSYTRDVRYLVENRPKEFRPGIVQVLMVLWNN